MNHTRRMIIRLLVAIGVLAGSLGSAFAGDETILSRFEGDWTSNGNAFGQEAISKMTWAKALGGQFTRIDYEIQMRSVDGETSTFSGLAFYRPQEDGTYKSFWADNTGDLHPISATEEEDALVSIWGVEGLKLGRSRYELTNPDTIIVTDWIRTDGEWKKFNSNTFARVEDTP